MFSASANFHRAERDLNGATYAKIYSSYRRVNRIYASVITFRSFVDLLQVTSCGTRGAMFKYIYCHCNGSSCLLFNRRDRSFTWFAMFIFRGGEGLVSYRISCSFEFVGCRFDGICTDLSPKRLFRPMPTKDL